MTLLDDALLYRDMGWTTIPLVNDEAGFPKRPFLDSWQKAQLGDVPGFPWERAIGLGVVLGPASGNLAVIDIDDVQMAQHAADATTNCYFVRTARKRGHLYVQEGTASASKALHMMVDGRNIMIELKARGTQVAAPPSPGYSIWNQAPVLKADSVAAVLTDLCSWLGYAPPPLSGGAYPTPWQHEVSVGDRNDAQFVEGCHLARAGMPFAEAVEVMRIRFQVAYQKDEGKDHKGEQAMIRTLQSSYQRVTDDHQREAAKLARGGVVV